MKIVQINAVCGKGSTGKICNDISKLLTQKNVENYILYSLGSTDNPNAIKFTNEKYLKIQALKSRVFGNYGFNSQYATKKLIKELEKINPDIVHLHNIHSNDVNLEMIFDYFRRNKVKVYWTFHDCWALTAYCPHFDMIGCDKWINGCHNCEQRKPYSWFFDKSKKQFERKKAIFEGVDVMVITPSKWLADVVKQSFLKNCEVNVVNNGIDVNVFKPTENDFREKYNLQDKKIVLGVAFGWGPKKGLDVFIELSKQLPENYQMVLVGTNDEVDKHLPANIISIHKTANQEELAKIYTAADVFANATREETFGLVNVEALACGTPVVTFETGGSPETIDEKCGLLVKKNDVEGLKQGIIRICEENPFSKEDCISRAAKFERNATYQKYVDLYFK